MSQTSIAEAKTQLTRLIHQAERGEAVHITRRGKPVAVLLSEDEYTRLRQGQKQGNLWDLIDEMRSDPAFEPVDWSQEEVDSWRDRRPVQEFQYIVGDRRYGYRPDTGTLYPKSGPGMVDIDRPQHQFLKKLNSVSQKEAMKFAKNTPGLDQKKIDQVLEIWRRCK
ncbi:type II toxin-antitoxin system Phd/YefM family antitoxin [Candidatus Thiosymbion oneisti]|uniref:type II toxin-antitoxin system Phd/YefM family antitoxin n=1 Tax=Candidatus Thiosymbion oneisti TaxID=589554 RepID=UPI00105BE077|nr:type II toxin-antitoxin system Phd/YefM family antitoxin [Candidatus Thiosymbion oneisti]